MTTLRRDQCRYQPYYCEENAWFLTHHPALDHASPHLVFVSNPTRTCAMWNQRAAAEGEPVVWDYHALVVGIRDRRPWVWDLDFRGPFPIQASEWLAASFAPPGALDPEWSPSFRPFDRADASRHVATDRRHMRVFPGMYVKPPPAWDPPGPTPDGEVHTLDRVLDFAGGEIGVPWLNQKDLHTWLESLG